MLVAAKNKEKEAAGEGAQEQEQEAPREGGGGGVSRSGACKTRLSTQPAAHASSPQVISLLALPVQTYTY
jgi:hypothetical protein